MQPPHAREIFNGVSKLTHELGIKGFLLLLIKEAPALLLHLISLGVQHSQLIMLRNIDNNQTPSNKLPTSKSRNT